jgi:ribosome biogenesis protein BMS1
MRDSADHCQCKFLSIRILSETFSRQSILKHRTFTPLAPHNGFTHTAEDGRVAATMESQNNRPHRVTKEKKQPKKGERNAKAFAVANPGRLAKNAVRTSDIREKRLHVPQIDRLPEEAPPIVVAVVGPPGVGKTTLIKSLIKRYSKQTLSHPTGPLTVVTSKRRRLTFIECPSDSLAAMMDVAKVADIILLMIDGNYGFEMETMEFLNALSTSGMPGNVFGILTHLDLFKKQSTLRMAKKRLKHRFWSELYNGAKLFYLSGVVNGRYPDREIHNLSRFLSVMKNPRPLVWRNSHPYCLADRFLDVTPPIEIEENEKCDRQVALYGYLRGTNFPAQNARVHIPGVGDLTVKEIEALPDPCPTPYLDQAMAKATGKSNRRKLGEKQKVLFAPMSDVGGVLVDKDAVYIDIKTNTFDKDADDLQDRGLGEQLMVGLQNEKRLLGKVDAGVRLFQGSTQITETEDGGRKERRGIRSFDGADQRPIDAGADVEDDDEGFVSGEESEDDDADDALVESGGRPGFVIEEEETDANANGDLAFADSDSDMGSVDDAGEDFNDDINSDDSDQEREGSMADQSDDEDDGGLRWKENMTANAQRLHGSRVAYRASDLSKLMYNLRLTPREVASKWRGESHAVERDVGDDDEENFFQKTDIEKEHDLEDRQTPKMDLEHLAAKWENEEIIASLMSRFTRASLATGANATEEGNEDDEDEIADFSDEGDGDFEDLEAQDAGNGQPAEQSEDVDLEDERAKNAKRKEELKLRFEEEDREGFGKAKDEIKAAEQEFGEDDWYDAQKAMLQKQLDINRAEFDSLDPASRARAEGYKAGTYARIVLDKVPCEFAESFNPRYPVIVGGLGATEDRFGFVQIRIKRHRWHKKILKTNDPLIFSLGWRRFQTVPLYSISDSRTRNRMLKYTPEHMHCFGTFYGPLVAPNTGFCCVQSFSNSNPGFRIAATGVVLNVDETTEIVKKLKLTGHPYKIFRNTAFIRDMFNSSIEIAKFEGASIKTVSGIRGQIKRALSKPEGHFRATFEDKILMSDIVFLRAWFPVRPHRFYNPVTNLLDAPTANEDGSSQWQAMRLTGAVRAAMGVSTPRQKDSAYTKIERPTRHFNPLRVPRAVQGELPFKSQITQQKARKAPTYLQKRAVVLGGEEKKARDLMQKLMTMRNEKAEKRAKKQEERRQVYRKKVAENVEKKAEREKRERDEFWQKEGRKRQRQEGGGGGGGGRGGGGKRAKTR